MPKQEIELLLKKKNKNKNKNKNKKLKIKKNNLLFLYFWNIPKIWLTGVIYDFLIS